MTTQDQTSQRVGFAPITRIDADRREIEVTATSEAVDAFGTVFDFDASRAAFERWLGNVREMHNAVAVGRRVAVISDPDRREVRVRLRISRGADATWQKVLDGTLCGASIGASNVKWREALRGDVARSGDDGDPTEIVRVATAYDLVELSLVDNPANPDCVGIALVRAATPNVTLLDDLDDAPADTIVIGGVDQGPPPAHAGMSALAGICGCATCRGVLAALDGTTHHAASPGEADLRADVRRLGANVAALGGALDALGRRQAEALGRMAAQIDQIANQPVAAGPVLRPADKRLVSAPATANIAERVAALQSFGAGVSDQHTQVALATEILRLQQSAL